MFDFIEQGEKLQKIKTQKQQDEDVRIRNIYNEIGEVVFGEVVYRIQERMDIPIKTSYYLI